MSHGIVYDIRSFSTHDGPGIRSTVFLKGCPLQCSWCHNPESQAFGIDSWMTTRRTGQHTEQKQEALGRRMTAREVLDELLPDKPFFEESAGGVTLSGGEPLSQSDFCLEILKLCRQQKIHTAVDTSGFASEEVMRRIIPWADLFLFDLKLMDAHEHKMHIRVDNQLILDNFRLLQQQKKKVIIRIPLVEGITDTRHNIDAIRKFLAGFPALERIDLLPYHSIARSKYEKLNMTNVHATHDNYCMQKARQLREELAPLASQVVVGG